MRTILLNGEKILTQRDANLQRGLETVGGNLVLTNSRLIFEPHSINIQKKIEIINLEDIDSITKAWTKFLNMMPLAKNSISVKVKNGNAFNFVVRDGWWWISSISDAKKGSFNNSNSQIGVADELKKLKELLDNGTITQSDFESQKKRLLG